VSQPICERSLDGFSFSWSDLPIQISLTRIKESSRGTTGEICCQVLAKTGKMMTLTHQSINLLTSRSRLSKDLSTRYPDAPWDAILEQICVMALRELRKGSPIESLEPGDASPTAWFALNPLIYEHNSTVLYGPGDSMKSFLALYCGLLMASGMSGPNLMAAPTRRRVLFLDWEMSVEDLRGRVQLLRAGDPRLDGTVDYRRCAYPLADEASDMKKVIAEGSYDMLILDSLAMAAGGGELEKAESAIRFNAALRGLECTSLVIGHTPKPNDEQKERSLYGSVFFHNLCRVSWEARREGQTVGLFQRKNNLGPKHDPIGFQLEIHAEACQITASDLSDEPTLTKSLPWASRINLELQKGTAMTCQDLASVLDADQAIIRTTLSRMEKAGRVGKLGLKVGSEYAWQSLDGSA
jgi:AAA domain